MGTLWVLGVGRSPSPPPSPPLSPPPRLEGLDAYIEKLSTDALLWLHARGHTQNSLGATEKPGREESPNLSGRGKEDIGVLVKSFL